MSPLADFINQILQKVAVSREAQSLSYLKATMIPNYCCVLTENAVREDPTLPIFVSSHKNDEKDENAINFQDERTVSFFDRIQYRQFLLSC